MRTTLTLEDDVIAKLRQRAHETGKPFKVVVNETLRLGLNVETTLSPKQPFQVKARPLGLRPGMQLDNIGELLEQLDGPAHR